VICLICENFSCIVQAKKQEGEAMLPQTRKERNIMKQNKRMSRGKTNFLTDNNNKKPELPFFMTAATATAPPIRGAVGGGGSKTAGQTLPSGVVISNRSYDDLFKGQVKTPIEVVYGVTKFPGNRRTDERVLKSAQRENLEEWGPEHCRDFVICTLTGYDVYHTGNLDNPIIEGHQGDQFLLNGNCRIASIRLGVVKEVPSHVWVEYVEVATFEEMQSFYESIDSSLATETGSDILGSMFERVGFEPTSKKYNDCSFAYAQNLVACMTFPQLWGKSGHKGGQGSFRPLPGEHTKNASDRIKKEQFVAYQAEHLFNDEQCARHGALTDGAKRVCRWDAISQAASMIKFRADGHRITPVHQEYLDRIFDPKTFTPAAIDSPIQYVIAEAMGVQGSPYHDGFVEFVHRNKFNHKLGMKPSVMKTLHWLGKMEEDGQVDKERKNFSKTDLSYNSDGNNGRIELVNNFKKYVKRHKVEFEVDVDSFSYPIHGANK